MFSESRQGVRGAWGSWLALLAGAIMPLGFAPFYAFPVCIFSLLLLFLSWRDVPASRAFWRGWLFGVGLFTVGISWIYVAIHVFGQASWPLAGGLTAGFIAFLALMPAMLGWLVKKSQHRRFGTAEYVVLLPIAWVAFEVFKSVFLSGFPWLEVGTAQIDSPLAGWIPLLGVYGASWLVALTAGLLLVAWQSRQFLWLLPALSLWALGPVLNQIDWTAEAGNPIRFSLIQGNIDQAIKWDAAQLNRTLSLYAELTADNWDSDLVIWPENAATAFFHQIDDAFLTPLAAEAARHDTELLIGLPVLDADGEQYYNSMAMLGEEPMFYHKKQLVPFGDYMPFEWLRGLIAFFDLPMSGFVPGQATQPLIKATGQTLGITICYEDAFTEEVRQTLPEATLLVNATNNAWYGDSFAPHQHLQISRSRALESGRPLLRVTTNGISAQVDHQGKIVQQSPQFATSVLSGEIQPRQGMTPYVQFGQWPFRLGLLLLLAGWAYYRIFYQRDEF
ncbi:Apolipoprotein N-acyltransferase / Copper homeostasis protein CutE [Methylophaga frappieri]|uniref:Apolipoprotein N-acyltransferase n=1 Tax=Methylophaga frappieri (strain ATCC BAA-2434 / DSM 25690 / JAM7) TaxID=754477 RepID=I1YJ43_METFJ|nr:apolipoprotein N-acyltransferase [Methylophaga frappieri]AFJ02936.1 Apolipoprotein N-acyltransferase / Copper homeostasis protein CutE [Methylophaga frappieri]